MALQVGKTAFKNYHGIKVLLGRKSGPVTVQVAGMKATFGEPYPYAKPFPYEEKSWGAVRMYFDKTPPRICENSKVILVEGNVASGKLEFAKRLAKGFDLKVFEPPPDDYCFLWHLNGFDTRLLNPILDEDARPYDLEAFLKDPNPKKGTVSRLVYLWYRMRFFRYCDALYHMLSTGQGVVVPRSAFAEMVFADSFRQMGYMTRKYHKFHTDYVASSICEVPKPHLTVYLDVPVNDCLNNIKARNNPKEGKNLDLDMLKRIEANYKEKFLPKMRRSGEVMEVEWGNKVDDIDMEVIIEEIAELKLEADNVDDSRFHDWYDRTKDDWVHDRQVCGNRDIQNKLFLGRYPYDCEEFVYSPYNDEYLTTLYNNHPALNLRPGTSPSLGNAVRALFK